MKTCRFCRQDVDPRARRCSHCQADLSLFGRFRLVQPIVSAAIAIGGVGFGFYEKHIAQQTETELEQEQQALTKVLNSVPERDLADKYKTGKNESELKAELKRNPKNIDARIRLRWLQRRGHAGHGKGRRPSVAGKSGRKVSSREQPNSSPASTNRPGNRFGGRFPRGRVVPASASRNAKPRGRGKQP